MLNIMMPRMDGHEVCRRPKLDLATGYIPVIFTTGASALLIPASTAVFGEYKLVLVLEYDDRPVDLGDHAKNDMEALLAADDDEGALDAAMSGHLIENLADQVSSARRGDRAELRLRFNHKFRDTRP